MSYGGLRGAIAFALVLLVDPQRIPRQKLFVTSTLAVLYFTVFFQVSGKYFQNHFVSIVLTASIGHHNQTAREISESQTRRKARKNNERTCARKSWL